MTDQQTTTTTIAGLVEVFGKEILEQKDVLDECEFEVRGRFYVSSLAVLLFLWSCLFSYSCSEGFVELNLELTTLLLFISFTPPLLNPPFFSHLLTSSSIFFHLLPSSYIFLHLLTSSYIFLYLLP